MNFRQKTDSTKTNNNSSNAASLVLILISILILVLSFAVSASGFSFPVRTGVFAVLIFLYLLFCVGFYFFQNQNEKRDNNESQDERSAKPQSPDIEVKLLALEETSTFFTHSLKISDAFRLVVNRIGEMVPANAFVLFLPFDEDKTKLKAVQATIENLTHLSGVEVNVHEGPAGKAFLGGKTERGEVGSFGKKPQMADVFKELKTAVALPLENSSEAFAVLVLYGKSSTDFTEFDDQFFERLRAAISPLFFKSINFERSLENALTDPLTNLPNERAFFLILENQIAESQRFRPNRSLTLLTADIKNFGEINSKYGHSTGDEILKWAGRIIKAQLRQMDFLARSSADEFLAVLPTASEEITKVIVERIEKAFLLNPFSISEKEQLLVELNFGTATFIKDGETGTDLLKSANLKKQEAKSGLNDSILWFPREYIN